MSRFRVVGIECDASYRLTSNGDEVATYGDHASGSLCGEEITLYGGATFVDVDREAKKQGWIVKGSGLGRVYLCPAHKEAVRA